MFEIDFIGVGEQSRSGDAITARFGTGLGDGKAWQDQRVLVVDGGFQSTAAEIEKHLMEYYGSRDIDLLISTHPDADHVNGLRALIEGGTVGELWMHRPWLHTAACADMFHDGRVTANSVSERLKRALDGASALEAVALERGIPIVEPFAGTTGLDDRVEVVGPTFEFYEELLPEFRSTPERASLSEGWVGRMIGGATAALTRVAETLDFETLSDSGTTSAENESSAILLLRAEPHGRVLLTGDAGIRALSLVAPTIAEAAAPSLFQAPHHGSQRNLGPTVLDAIVGERGQRPRGSWCSVISAAPGGAPKHPHPRVTNALLRRGAHVTATAGRNLHWGQPRDGWGRADPIPFIDEFEVD